MRRTIIAVGVALFGLAVASAWAGTINGTKSNDTLHGTLKADRLYGLAGNDRLYGLAGNDYLNGGSGDDAISGGPGADTLVCGPGKDTAVADATDTVGADCETVLGLPKPVVSVTGGSQPEGNGSSSMTFTVTLAKAGKLKATVAYATADGTATQGADYVATSGTLTFGPGETSKAVAVSIVGDQVVEPDETFTLKLSNAVNATLGTATATGTITNDDAAKAKPGHYHGSISTGGFVDFDVSADSTTVTGLTMLPFLTCTPGDGTGIYQLHFSDTSPIQSDLTFAANGSGDGITVTFQGKFNPDANLATGTLHIHLAYDEGGAHYDCDSGTSSWGAALRS